MIHPQFLHHIVNVVIYCSNTYVTFLKRHTSLKAVIFFPVERGKFSVHFKNLPLAETPNGRKIPLAETEKKTLLEGKL